MRGGSFGAGSLVGPICAKLCKEGSGVEGRFRAFGSQPSLA